MADATASVEMKKNRDSGAEMACNPSGKFGDRALQNMTDSLTHLMAIVPEAGSV